jgi:porin
MIRRSITAALMCGCVVGLSSGLASGARAADLATKAPPQNFTDEDFLTRPYLLGDLYRKRLHDLGFDWSLEIRNESVGNLSGGTRDSSANAGQMTLGLKFDMAKLAGISGGLLGATFVQRWGDNLNGNANIPAFMLTDEIFGRGQIMRTTELYWDQQLLNGFLELKGGRLPVGSDFFYGPCDYINLTFCGGAPGNVYGGYIFNFPISQWGGIIKAHVNKDVTVQVGFYDANPNYLSTDPETAILPTFPSSNPNAGVMIPVELDWTPTLNGMPGIWKFGAWYNTATLPDALTAANLTGVVPTFTQDTGAYGFYVSIIQQLTASRGAGDPHGLSTFFNGTWGDPRTSAQDYQVALGLRYLGTFASRPSDEVAIAVGATHENPRVSELETLANAGALSGIVGPGFVQGTEVPIEAWYGWQATGWLNLKFDAQYVVNPGGYSVQTLNGVTTRNGNAFILGMRTTVEF